MKIYIAIFLLATGFVANRKIIDKLLYKNEEYAEERIEEKYSKMVLILSILFYFFGSMSLFFSNLSQNQMIIGSIFFNMLYIVSIIDYFTMYIYESVLFSYAALLFLSKIVLGEMSFITSLYLLLISGGLYGIIYIIAKWIYKREAFGLGDVYLMAIIGAVMSFDTIVLAVFLPFYIAPIFLLVRYLANRSNSFFKSEIPFGPYMCLAGWIAFIYGDIIMNMYFNMIGM